MASWRSSSVSQDVDVDVEVVVWGRLGRMEKAIRAMAMVMAPSIRKTHLHARSPWK